MKYSDDLIAGRVSKRVRQRVKEHMDILGLTLYDSFKVVAMEEGKRGTQLYNAWYNDDFRKYIPSVYREEYLDFEKYPLKY